MQWIFLILLQDACCDSRHATIIFNSIFSNFTQYTTSLYTAFNHLFICFFDRDIDCPDEYNKRYGRIFKPHINYNRKWIKHWRRDMVSSTEVHIVWTDVSDKYVRKYYGLSDYNPT